MQKHHTVVKICQMSEAGIRDTHRVHKSVDGLLGMGGHVVRGCNISVLRDQQLLLDLNSANLILLV